ncbi:hypothetical protein [Natrinema caseinilyticum]|uniref:hypothetical protein n=1 Tax=Natrinema caseinilyticum TaxID=2961570 RepID=UPI0020C5045C|nr:hypothetical protein [Natrinema caseinilyticum]
MTGDEDGDLVTHGGILVGFLGEAWLQPTAVVRRLWAFGTPTIEKETPTENFEVAVLGFYALNSESVVQCKPDVTKESFADFSCESESRIRPAGFCSSATISPHISLPSLIT